MTIARSPSMNAPRRKNRRLAAILLPLLIFVTSCDRVGQKDKESLFKEIDADYPGLSEFSPFLAAFMWEIRTEHFMCDVWKTMSKSGALETKKKETLPSEAQKLLDELRNKLKQPETKRRPFEARLATCEATKETVANNDKIAKSVLATETIPDSAFVFYALKPNDGGSSKLLSRVEEKYEIKPVGFFMSLEECNDAEGVYRRFDIATKPCRALNQKNFRLLFMMTMGRTTESADEIIKKARQRLLEK